jgi:hypothetical protein
MFAIVARLRRRARTMPVKSPFTSVTPALSIATSVPVPIAIPTRGAVGLGQGSQSAAGRSHGTLCVGFLTWRKHEEAVGGTPRRVGAVYRLTKGGFRAGRYVAESKWTRIVPVVSAIIITLVGVGLTAKAIADIVR